MWPLHRVWARVAHVAVERLPAGARVLVVGPLARHLADVLQEWGLDAMAVAAVSSAAGEAGQAAWDMVVLCLVLSDKTEEDRYTALEAARNGAPLALLVDWQRAERNLEVPADGMRRFFSRMAASPAKRRTLAAYDAAGGLEGVLYALRQQGRMERMEARQACLGGCVGLALFTWGQCRHMETGRAGTKTTRTLCAVD